MDLSKLSGKIWLDGELVPWQEAKVHVLTHTFHYGLGVFEGVRAYSSSDQGTCIFRLKEHTDRLFRSAKIMQMDMPWDKDALNAAQREFVEYVLRNYVSVGVDELDIAKLSTVIEAKYGSIDAAQKQLGAVQDIRQTFIDFQQQLYANAS